jgi:putative peptide zinc metalloprotease protein
MSTTFSEHWYRVAPLHPRLRSHVRVDRHCYRGEVWHVLKDPLSGRQHRLNELGYRLVGRFDGRLSVQEVWDCAVAEAGDAAPTQPESIALLAQLHDAGLIQTEAAPDVAELFDRADERRVRERRRRLNPLSLRASLVDPTPLLDALAPLAALFLRRWAAFAWLALVLLALAKLAPHTGALGAYASQHLATPRSLLVMWLVYPLIKALHEFAHALAVRVWGGEVREMGISLLLLMPVPYVDASAAAGFRERHRRVLVSLMGVLAETTLAALAAFVWLGAADGVLREIGFAVMLIGGVSTLLFNGNPLMRFDAYHALADAIESPGLAARSNAYWLHLARRHLMGVANAPAPSVARGERRWLLGYGLASGAYRVVVSLAIVAWLASVHPLLGRAIALALLFGAFARPAWKLLRYVRGAAELRGRRARAGMIAALAVGAPLLLVFALPVPDATRAEGVVWVPEQAQVRSEGEGFIDSVGVADGQQVVAGDLIVQLRDPALDTELERVQARLRGLDVAYHGAIFNQPALANTVEQDRVRARAELAHVQARIEALAVRSRAAGRVALAHAQDLPGLFIARGTLVAHVLAPEQASVRVIVSEADVARVQQRPGTIEVRLADADATTMTAQLRAQTPAAARTLPSAALGDRAGGSFVTDPSDPDGLRTLEPLFTFDLVVPQRALDRVGVRALARFDHGSRPLAAQWLHRLRQVFIGEFAGAAQVASIAR